MFRRFRAFEASPIYEFKDPDTGFIQRAPDLKTLTVNVIKYRVQNDLEPIEHLNHVIENYLCGLPENCNKCQQNEDVQRGFMTIVKGGISLLKMVMFKKYVTQEVADTRAAQCVKCPNNVFPDKHGFLQWSDDAAIAMVGDRKSKYHEELGNCGCCTCVLKSKVFYDGAQKHDDNEIKCMKAVDCWQLKEFK